MDAQAATQLRLLLIDCDKEWLRKTMFALSMQPSITVVGSACTLDDGLKLVQERRSSVVMVGRVASAQEAAEAVFRIKQGTAGCKVIAVTEASSSAELGAMRIAGSDGVVPRLAGPERLLFKLSALIGQP